MWNNINVIDTQSSLISIHRTANGKNFCQNLTEVETEEKITAIRRTTIRGTSGTLHLGDFLEFIPLADLNS